jgi:hypothetical protein
MVAFIRSRKSIAGSSGRSIWLRSQRSSTRSSSSVAGVMNGFSTARSSRE